MSSCHNTPEFNCNETTMYQHIEQLSYNQAPESSQYQDSLIGTTDNYSPSNQLVWTSEHSVQETALFNRNLCFGPHNFHNDSLNQHYSVQYTPLTPEPVSHPVFNMPRPYQNNNLMSKKHQGRITFVPTKTGNFKAIVKSKRKRTIFTRKQVEDLEDIFKIKQYITREEREVIVNQLQLSDKSVKIWFQNRRLKDKKGSEQIDEDMDNVPPVEERTSPDIARLNYVESKINEKTDEFGYVTLDDGVMRDLIDVIDDFLTNRSHQVENISEDGGSPVYEPISPASDSNDEENATGWKPSEPNESLQRLFDLQTML